MKTWGKRFCFFLLIFLAFIGLKHLWVGGNHFGKSIGVLKVEGTIWTADEIIESIEEFQENPNIAGIVVRINSPGGTVGASQEIYENLKELSAKKPVVASMGTLAASGGLYVALGATKIFAEPGTVTGSIGVRMEHVNIGDFLRWAKINYETIKSGAFKDLASGTRALTVEERKLLEDLMHEFHVQFQTAVAESRGLKMEELERFADGRIFTGTRAKGLKLVDELGGFSKAVAMAGELAGIIGKPHLIYAEKRSAWWVRTFFESVQAYWHGPQICYLYP